MDSNADTYRMVGRGRIGRRGGLEEEEEKRNDGRNRREDGKSKRKGGIEEKMGTEEEYSI